MSFATENFAGSAAQELAAYNASWSKQSGFTTSGLIGVDGQYFLANNNTAYAVYQHSASPTNADYDVSADVKHLGGTEKPQMGVCGRMASGAGTFYCTLHTHASNLTRLYKCVSGTFTELGNYSNTLSTGTAQRHLLRMVGTSIKVFIDGVERISVTNSDITAAGKAGIIGFGMRDSGVADTGSIDNWAADNAASPSDLSSGVTLDAVAPSGTLTSASGTFTGNVDLSAVAPSGSMGLQPGTVLVTALTNWNGSVQASVTIPWVTYLKLTDAIQVLVLANQTTDSSGNLSATSAVLVAGTWYMVVGFNADGTQRFAVPVLAT